MGWDQGPILNHLFNELYSDDGKKLLLTSMSTSKPSAGKAGAETRGGGGGDEGRRQEGSERRSEHWIGFRGGGRSDGSRFPSFPNQPMATICAGSMA